jgi:hypothetical protein
MEVDNNKISISNSSIVVDIQKAFNTLYPFLRIDFVKTDTTGKAFKSSKIDSNTPLKQLIKLDAQQEVDVSNNRTIAEVANDFEQVLGIMVQLSRKSGNVWNEISLTDSWTLKSQNAAGEFISSEMAKP